MRKFILFVAMTAVTGFASFAEAQTVPSDAVFDPNTGMYVVLDSSGNVTATYPYQPGTVYTQAATTTSTNTVQKDDRLACPLYVGSPTIEGCRKYIKK